MRIEIPVLTFKRIADDWPQIAKGSEPTKHNPKLIRMIIDVLSLIAAKIAKNLIAAKLPQNIAVTIAPSDFVCLRSLSTTNVAM